MPQQTWHIGAHPLGGEWGLEGGATRGRRRKLLGRQLQYPAQRSSGGVESPREQASEGGWDLANAATCPAVVTKLVPMM